MNDSIRTDPHGARTLNGLAPVSADAGGFVRADAHRRPRRATERHGARRHARMYGTVADRGCVSRLAETWRAEQRGNRTGGAVVRVVVPAGSSGRVVSRSRIQQRHRVTRLGGRGRRGGRWCLMSNRGFRAVRPLTRRLRGRRQWLVGGRAGGIRQGELVEGVVPGPATGIGLGRAGRQQHPAGNHQSDGRCSRQAQRPTGQHGVRLRGKATNSSISTRFDAACQNNIHRADRFSPV